MIDNEFERKGREMSDKLNQIVDLEYTWGDFPALTADQIYANYDARSVCAQVVTCNGAVVMALQSERDQLRAELEQANKRAKAEQERGEALTKLAEYECDITRLLELFRRQAIRSFIAGARDTYFGLRGESLSSADLKFVSDSAEMRFPYVAESFRANDDIVSEYTALIEKYL